MQFGHFVSAAHYLGCYLEKPFRLNCTQWLRVKIICNHHHPLVWRLMLTSARSSVVLLVRKTKCGFIICPLPVGTYGFFRAWWLGFKSDRSPKRQSRNFWFLITWVKKPAGFLRTWVKKPAECNFCWKPSLNLNTRGARLNCWWEEWWFWGHVTKSPRHM